MKTIGIKLADGTFYPILEEGTPKQRMLDLTTAKDNQTKVQIDLYRSETGTMEDAEYVDTLEVTKLKPHPNGEPELHLSVGLDENNHLTAEVVDPETGKKSETEVTLVSRTLAERENSAESDVTGATATDADTFSTEDFSFEDYDDNALASKEEAESNALADLPDFSDQLIEDDPTDLDPSVSETTLSPEELPEIKSDALEDMPFSFDHSEAFSASEPNDTTADTTTDTFDGALPDFSDLDNDIVEDNTLESVTFSGNDAIADANEPTSTDSPIEAENPDLNIEDFSLPDFDTPADTSDSSALSTSTSGFSFDDLNDPAFNTTEFDSTVDSLNSEPENKFFDDIDTSVPSGSAMDFSDLYDKETLAGEHASLYDEDEEHKKTRVPVIICIICAIICVIATILVLFVVPSKYNLIASRNTNGISILDRFFSKDKTEKVEEVPAHIEEPKAEEPKEETKFIDVVVEEPADVPAPAAQEDKIVIAPEPEKVVPEPAPVVEEKRPEKTADVRYHIKWGDTLWDISESYYKTPWKYPKIANYNNIKNPDLIISGTDILIPAE